MESIAKRERKELGAKIKKNRIALGFSPKQVAGALGIVTSVYKEMEAGDTSIGDWQLQILETMLRLNETDDVDAEPAEKEKLETPEEKPAAIEIAIYEDEEIGPADVENDNQRIKVGLSSEDVDILIEHITDIKISKQDQRRLFRALSAEKAAILEKELFG